MRAGTSVAELRSEQPSFFEYRDKLFYVTVPALGFPLAIPPDTFLRNFEAAAKAIVVYHAAISGEPTECEVIPFCRKDRRRHAALVHGSTCSRTSS